MVPIESVSDESLVQSVRLIRDEILARGWTATVPYAGSSHVYITRPDGKELPIFGSAPSTTPYAAAHAADDKYVMHCILVDAGVTQLETTRINERTYGDVGAEWLSRHRMLVVKPIDAAHGHGVSANVSTPEELALAVKRAFEFSKRTSVILQERYAHDTMFEFRILCIDGVVIGALHRQPARVFGDGTHTVAELVGIENARPERGLPYKQTFAEIPSIDMNIHMTRDELLRIPTDGEEVVVLGVANYGKGGEIIDVTDLLPKWLIKEAEKVAKITLLPVVGIDFMTAVYPRVDASEEELDAIVLEVNKSPSLSIHDHPTQGKPRGAVKAFVDYLARV